MENDTDVRVDEKLTFTAIEHAPEISVCESVVEDKNLEDRNAADASAVSVQPTKYNGNAFKNAISEDNLLKSVVLKIAQSNSEETVGSHTAIYPASEILTSAEDDLNQTADKILTSSSDSSCVDTLSSIGFAVELMSPKPEWQIVDVVKDQHTTDGGASVSGNCGFLGDDRESKSLVSPKRSVDVSFNESVSPSRHCNVFELEFLQSVDKTNSSISKDSSASRAESDGSTEVVATALSSTSGEAINVPLTECSALNFSANNLNTFNSTAPEGVCHSKNLSPNGVCQTINGTSEIKQEMLDYTVKEREVSYDECLKDDVKLWCQTYVKLVDCANLLLLTIPSVIKDNAVATKLPTTIPFFIKNTLLEMQSPATVKSESVFQVDSCLLPVKSQGMTSAVAESGEKPSVREESNFLGVSDLQSDVGPKKKKVPTATLR